jgi:hypothetical protein
MAAALESAGTERLMWWRNGGGAEAELLIGPVGHQGRDQAVAIAMNTKHCWLSNGIPASSVALVFAGRLLLWRATKGTGSGSSLLKAFQAGNERHSGENA